MSKVQKAEIQDLLNNPHFKKGQEIVNKITCSELSTNQNEAKFEITVFIFMDGDSSVDTIGEGAGDC